MNRSIMQTIGRAERSLRALLDTRISAAGLEFPDWVALVFLSGGDGLRESEIARRMVFGDVASDEEAGRTVVRLRERGLVSVDGDLCTLTEAGRQVFMPLRMSVDQASKRALEGIAPEDLAVAERVLERIAGAAMDIRAS